MRKWRSSAAYRIAFLNFGAYAVGLAILGAIVFGVMHVAFSRQLDSMIADEARTLVDEYRAGGNGELAEAIAAREASTSATRMLYAVVAPDGRRLYGSVNVGRPNVGLHEIEFVDPVEGPDTAHAMAVDLTPGERLVVAVDSDWIETIERIILIVFAAAFAGACLVGFGGAVILGNYLERRLRAISSSAEAIIGGDIRRRVPVSARRDEFDRLAVTLNRMLDRIETLLENLRQVSSGIAHDLRTPLSNLRSRLEQSTRETVTSAEAATVLEDAVGRLDDVLSLFAAILRIAEIESGETRRYFSIVDVSELATELAESFAPSIEDDGRNLFWSIEPGLAVDGDRELLAQAIINLLENAQRHTPPGTVIRFTLVAADNLVCIRVADSGPGVPKSDFGKITKHFSRLEGSRDTPGHGLGLSLVSAVAKLHAGRLLFGNLQPGLSATLELPGVRNANQPNV